MSSPLSGTTKFMPVFYILPYQGRGQKNLHVYNPFPDQSLHDEYILFLLDFYVPNQ